MELNYETVSTAFKDASTFSNPAASTLFQFWISHPNNIGLCIEIFNMEYDISNATLLFITFMAANEILEYFGKLFSPDDISSFYESVCGLRSRAELKPETVSKSYDMIARLVSLNPDLITVLHQSDYYLTLQVYYELFRNKSFQINGNVSALVMQNSQQILLEGDSTTPLWMQLLSKVVEYIEPIGLLDPIIDKVCITSQDQEYYKYMNDFIEMFTAISYNSFNEDDKAVAQKIIRMVLDYATNLRFFDQASQIFSQVIDYGFSFFDDENNSEILPVIFGRIFSAIATTNPNPEDAATLYSAAASCIHDLYVEGNNTELFQSTVYPIIEEFLSVITELIASLYENSPSDLYSLNDTITCISECNIPEFDAWLAQIITECTPITMFITQNISDNNISEYSQALMEALEVDEENVDFSMNFISTCAVFCNTQEAREKAVSLAFSVFLEQQTKERAITVRLLASKLPRIFAENASEILEPLVTEVSSELLPDIILILIYGAVPLKEGKALIDGALEMATKSFAELVQNEEFVAGFELAQSIVRSVSEEIKQIYVAYKEDLGARPECKRAVELGFDPNATINAFIGFGRAFANSVLSATNEAGLLMPDSDDAMDAIVEFVSHCLIEVGRERSIVPLVFPKQVFQWAAGALSACPTSSLLELLKTKIVHFITLNEMHPLVEMALQSESDELAAGMLAVVKERCARQIKRPEQWGSLLDEIFNYLLENDFLFAALANPNMPQTVSAEMKMLMPVLYFNRRVPDELREALDEFYATAGPRIAEAIFHAFHTTLPDESIEDALRTLRDVALLGVVDAGAVTAAIADGVSPEDRAIFEALIAPWLCEAVLAKPASIVLFTRFHIIPCIRG